MLYLIYIYSEIHSEQITIHICLELDYTIHTISQKRCMQNHDSSGCFADGENLLSYQYGDEEIR